MVQPRHGFYPYLVWLILKAALYGSWILGLFPFTIHSRGKEVACSRWLRVYGLIMNNLLIFLPLYFYLTRPGKRNLEAFDRNHLLEKVNTINLVINYIGIVVAHFMNFCECEKVRAILNEFLDLEYCHFEGQNRKNCPKFNSLVIQKCVTVIYEMVSLLTIHYGMPGNKISFLTVLTMCLSQIGINLYMMHSYVGILFIYRYVWFINGQLLELVNQLRVNPATDSSRIRVLSFLYRRLLELSTKIASVYEWQIMLVLGANLVGNVMVTFFLIVFGISMHKLTIFLVVFPQSFLVNLWDFWLSVTLCDLIESTGRGTATILKLFSDLDTPDVELERSINEFTWLCSHAKFRFRLLGMFSINKNMGFLMILTSILYLLYLVQFDFMNL